MKQCAFYFTFLILFLSSCQPDETETVAPTPKVVVVPVTIQDVQIKQDFVGQVYGILDIPIRTRVEGFLEGQHFNEGRRVKKGQLLYTVDSQPFDEAVIAAQSNLAQADVSLVKANNDLARVEPLNQMKAISDRDLDAAVAEKGAAEALVQANQANLRLEEIRRGYTKIMSPIDGIIGKTSAKIGEFVGRSPNPVILNTISKIDSIRVEFFITEREYLNFMSHFDSLSAVELKEKQPLELILANGEVFDQIGYVDFINRQIDETTGTMLIQATFPNPKRVVRPGQFAKVRLTVATAKDGMLIPQRSVTELQGIQNVMVLGADSVVTQKTIEITGPYKDYYLVSSGIDKGDLIVFEGLQKAKNGIKVDATQTVFESQYVNP